MNPVESYLSYIRTQKRYSQRTAEIYESVLDGFYRFQDSAFGTDCLCVNALRSYQIHLMDECGMSARTVNQHLSVLSGYCRYLVRQGLLKSNPVELIVRPKQSKRLPTFYKSDEMTEYLDKDNALARRDFELDLRTHEEKKDTYSLCLNRIIVSLLYSTGIRRSELIGLRMRDVDFSRRKMRVRGKGDKMREIPLTEFIIQELSLYLQSVERLAHCNTREEDDPLLVTLSGGPLYPVAVDRAVKKELGDCGRSFAGQKSPHILRHTLATGLLENGADITSIKELLGHANLAATQVYTHSSLRQLKKVYETSHPRAFRGMNGSPDEVKDNNN